MSKENREQMVSYILKLISAKDKDDFVVILTGEIDSISKLFTKTTEVMSEFEYLIDMTKIEKSDMLNVAKGYITQNGYKAAEDVPSKIESLLMGMEQGNLDRMITAIDKAIENAAKRDPDNKMLIVKDF